MIRSRRKEENKITAVETVKYQKVQTEQFGILYNTHSQTPALLGNTFS